MKAHTRSALLASVGAVVTAAAVTMAPAAAFAAPGTAQDSQTFKVGKVGKISARGAAVEIPVAFSCQQGWEASVGIQLVEARGDNGLASGWGNKNLPCTGGVQKVLIYLQANTFQGALPFKPGDASAVASLDSYDPDAQGCSDDMGCPVPAAPAAPPAGMHTNASLAGGQGVPTSSHSEFHGTVTIVK